MKKDYTWPGKKGDYWVHFEEHPNGGCVAQATEPIDLSGGGGYVGPIARRHADTEDDAERLLIEELQRIDARDP